MTRAFIRQLLSDLRSRPVQITQLFLILAAAGAALTFAFSLTRTSSALWRAFFARAEGAELSFLARDSDVDLSHIADMSAVVRSAGPHPVLLGRILRQDPVKHNVTVIGYDSEAPAVDRPLITAGRWLDPEGDAEIVLDPNFAAEIGAEVGDSVEMLQPDGHVALEVVGLAISPSWPYPLRATAPGHVLASTLSAIEPDPDRWVSLLSVRLISTMQPGDFAAEVTEQYSETDINLIWDEAENRERVQFWDRPAAGLLAVFSAFALIGVGIIVAYATSANVLAQYREIGLLKAIGFTPRQVTLLLITGNLLVGLLAGVVGVAVGIFLSPFIQPADLLRSHSVLFDIDPLADLSFGVYAGPLALLLALVALATLWPAWRGGRIPTLRAISVGFGQTQRGPSRLTRLSSLSRVPTAIGVGIKGVLARPRRALLTLVGLILTIGILTIAFLIESTRLAYIEQPSSVGFPFDFILERNYLGHQETVEILEAHSEVKDYAELAYTSAVVDDTLIRLDIRAIGGDFSRLTYKILEGRTIEGPNEAIVAPGLLERTELELGDRLDLTTGDGDPLDLVVVGTFLDIEGSGEQGIVIGMDSYLETYPDREPVEYGLFLEPAADERAIRASLLTDSNGHFGLEVWGLAEEMTQLRAPMIAMSLALGLIAVVNLLYTTQLAVQERYRDFGILKAIGLTPAQVGLGVIAGMGLLSIAAVIVGLPLGLLAGRLVMVLLGELFRGGGALPQYINWSWVVVLFPVAIALAVLGSLIPAMRVARMNVTEALRYE